MRGTSIPARRTCVVPVTDPGHMDIRKEGRAVRKHPAFAPEGANANFISREAAGGIGLRTYETGRRRRDPRVRDRFGRRRTGRVDDLYGFPSPVPVRVRSGETLTVHFAGSAGAWRDVYLEGSARVLFSRDVPLRHRFPHYRTGPMSPYTFIVNPAAGQGTGSRILDPLETELRSRRIPYDLVMTTGPGHATRAARESTSANVVAVGGDGTVNEVANGLLGSDKALGILRRGIGERLHQIRLDSVAASSGPGNPSPRARKGDRPGNGRDRRRQLFLPVVC